MYHSTLGLSVIEKKKKVIGTNRVLSGLAGAHRGPALQVDSPGRRSPVLHGRVGPDVQRFRGGLVFKDYVSLNSRLESNREEEEGPSAVRSVWAVPEGVSEGGGGVLYWW